MSKFAEVIDHAIDVGRWKQALAEANRCRTIYESEEARVRPEAAWLVIPLGHDLEASRKLIAQSVEEPDPALWEARHSYLHKREQTIEQQYKLWSTPHDRQN